MSMLLIMAQDFLEIRGDVILQQFKWGRDICVLHLVLGPFITAICVMCNESQNI